MNMHRCEVKAAKRTIHTPHIELRLAKAEDANRVAKFLGEFFAVSRWADNLTFHEAKATTFLDYAISTGQSVYLIATERDGELVGVCSYHIWDVFTDPIAVMDETHTVPKYGFTDLAGG